MDDFDLKKYLAEGKLEERIFRDGKMYQNQEDYKTQMSLEYEKRPCLHNKTSRKT